MNEKVNYDTDCLIPVITLDGVGWQIPPGRHMNYLSYGDAPWGVEYAFFEVAA